MDAHGAGHLGEAGDGLLHLVRAHHHEVGQLVDDDHDVVERLQGLAFLVLALLLLRPDDVVELLDVAHALGGELADALLHLPDRPLEDVRGDLGIGDHGGEEVGDVLVDPELEALGVDEDQAHLVRGGAEEEARDHAVEPDALAGAGGAGDQQVGHGREVGEVGLPAHGLAEDHAEAARGPHEGLGLEHLTQGDGLAVLVRDLDAHRAPAAHAVDADALRLQGEGKIVGEADDLRVLDARVGLELVGGDHGSRVDLDHAAEDAELRRLALQRLGPVEEPRLVEVELGLELVEEASWEAG